MKTTCSLFLLLGALRAFLPVSSTKALGFALSLAKWSMGQWEGHLCSSAHCVPVYGCSAGSGHQTHDFSLCLYSSAVLSLLHSTPAQTMTTC